MFEGYVEDNIVIGYFDDDLFVEEYVYCFSDIDDGNLVFVFIYDGIVKYILINLNLLVGIEDLIVMGKFFVMDSVF